MKQSVKYSIVYGSTSIVLLVKLSRRSKGGRRERKRTTQEAPAEEDDERLKDLRETVREDIEEQRKLIERLRRKMN